VLKEHPMSVKISFPEPPRVPSELPLYAAVPPAWTADRVAEVGARLGVRGEVADGGVWFVVKDGASTVEVYQASQSVRFERDDFDAEGRNGLRGNLDREKAILVAQQFHDLLGGPDTRPELHSVSELEVLVSTREKPAPERRVVALQVNHRYTVDGLALVGPGAKAQVTVGRDGTVGQAYRFWRDVKQTGARASVPAERAFERFAATEQFASLPDSARVKVASVQVGLLCLPPTESQGILVPTYVLRGEVATEFLPRYQFVTYVAAAEIDEADAKRRRWQAARPALLVA
jgi:hypothetical protein